MPEMSLVFVSKKACQHIFVLSDPGVPRTFVGDCRLPILNDGKSYSRESDFSQIEIAKSSRYRGQTVIEVDKCEALSRLRILRKS